VIAITAVEWESREWDESLVDNEKYLKAGPSLKSSLLALKKPHKLTEEKKRPIYRVVGSLL
jgi:hypothetical protein